MLPGLEFARIAAHETGADMEAAQAVLKEWFLVFILGGSLVLLLGCAALAVAVMRTRPLGGRPEGVVAGGLIVFALGRLVPIARSSSVLFGISAFVIGPAISSPDPADTSQPAGTPSFADHDSHHSD